MIKYEKRKLTFEEKSKLLYEHRCPDCGTSEMQFYYPNSIKNDIDTIENEIECERCGFYVIMESEIKVFRERVR